MQLILQRPFWLFASGIGFAFAIALAGFGLARIPFLHLLGPMLLAILAAILYRHFAGYPEALRSGIDFSAKKILRFAIILYGFKLNMAVILGDGLSMLLKGAFVIALSLLITMFIAKRMKADSSLSLLLAVGAGVCGAAAIAAVSPVTKAKDEDTAVGVGIIALIGTLFAAAYALIYAFFPISPIHYGSWSGISLHEIAHVVAASTPAGEDALAVGLLAKLGRVFLLIPLCFLLAYWMNRKHADDEQVAGRVPFPWFLIGFICTSLIGTYVPIPDQILDMLALLSTFLLTSAMVGLGLNVNFQVIRNKALKPVIAMSVSSLIISVIAFLLV